MLGAFATMLFTHNSQVSLMCFALGFAFGVPTVMLLLYNGCMLGAFLAIYVTKGLGWKPWPPGSRSTARPSCSRSALPGRPGCISAWRSPFPAE
jgi:hypothetical protein